MKKFRSLRDKSNLPTILAYTLLRFIVIIILVLNVFQKNYENVFTCFLTLVLFLIPFFIEDKFNIEMPTTLEIIILLFIFSAQILGELNSFYLKIPNWDTILHTINGFIMGAIGLSLIDLLNTSDNTKIKLTPIFGVFVSFCFSMTIGVLWEFIEFSFDKYVGLDMQKDTIVEKINTVSLDETNSNIVVSVPIETVEINGEVWDGYLDIGLIDTMNDLLVNLVGALVFSFFGYFYLKYRRHKGIEELLIVKRKSN